MEHAAVRYLAQLAGLPIAIRVVRSKKNSPAEQFLQGLNTAFDGEIYTLTHDDALHLEYKPPPIGM